MPVFQAGRVVVGCRGVRARTLRISRTPGRVAPIVPCWAARPGRTGGAPFRAPFSSNGWERSPECTIENPRPVVLSAPRAPLAERSHGAAPRALPPRRLHERTQCRDGRDGGSVRDFAL